MPKFSIVATNWNFTNRKKGIKLIIKSLAKKTIPLQNIDRKNARIHNSNLINLACIKSYHKGKGGSVILTDGTEVEVSTRRKDDFLKKLSKL